MNRAFLRPMPSLTLAWLPSVRARGTIACARIVPERSDQRGSPCRTSVPSPGGCVHGYSDAAFSPDRRRALLCIAASGTALVALHLALTCRARCYSSAGGR